MDILPSNKILYTAGCALFLIVLKNISEIKRCTSNKPVSVSIIIILTLFILIEPILFVLLCGCGLYRELVKLFLKMKHGSKFVGLMQGSDAFHTVGKPSDGVIHILMMIQCIKKRSPEDFFQNISKVLWKLSQHSKFKMIFRKSFGYSYMLKGDVTKDDCIKKMKTIDCQKEKLEKAELMASLNECCNAPLPKNETLSWEVLVGTQPVDWKQDGIDYYPLVFRINHAVADGVTLFKLMVGTLADKLDVNIKDKENAENAYIRKMSSSLNNHRNGYSVYKEMPDLSKEYLHFLAFTFYKRMRRTFELIMMSFKILLLAPASLIVTFNLKGKDFNILRGPPLTGQKILVLKVEDSPMYFQKVKYIKKKIPETTFPDVLLTACSASLTDYFQKNTTCPPEHITATIPMLSGSADLRYLVPGEFDARNLKNVGNGYSLLLMNLPIEYKNEQRFKKDRPLLNRLMLIQEERNILKNSIDYQVNYFMMSVVSPIIPHPVAKLIMRDRYCSTIFTALPGPPKVTYCGGTMIPSDIIAWVPHLYNIGTTFLINTYDGRLHVSVSTDKGVIADEFAAQSIVEGIYKYLDLLEKEVNCVYENNN